MYVFSKNTPALCPGCQSCSSCACTEWKADAGHLHAEQNWLLYFTKLTEKSARTDGSLALWLPEGIYQGFLKAFYGHRAEVLLKKACLLFLTVPEVSG